jgi:hypothetical protein
MRARRLLLQCSMLMVVSCFTTAVLAAGEAPLLPKDAPPHMRRPPPRTRFYPEVAQRLGVEGHASALCRVGPNGDLTDCTVQSEEPSGCGFGEALLGIVDLMQVPPRAKDGTGTPGRPYLFNFNFKLPTSRSRGATSCSL